jgi:hypothetical protein
MPSTNTKQSTAESTKTDIKDQIHPSLLTAVKNLIKADDALTSKYWPLISQAQELLRSSIERKEAIRIFGLHYMKAAAIDEVAYKTLPQHAGRKVMLSKVIAIAYEIPSERIAKHKADNKGFWSLYEMTRDGLPGDGPKAKASAAKAKAKPSVGKNNNSRKQMEEDAEEDVANAAEYAESFERTAPDDITATAKALRRIYKRDLDDFLKVVGLLIDWSVLPEDIVETLQDWWNDK